MFLTVLCAQSECKQGNKDLQLVVAPVTLKQGYLEVIKWRFFAKRLNIS